jgi:hypothetical protein
MHYEGINYQDMLRFVESSHDGANKSLCEIHSESIKLEPLVAMREKPAGAQMKAQSPVLHCSTEDKVPLSGGISSAHNSPSTAPLPEK